MDYTTIKDILVIEDNHGDFALVEEYLFEQLSTPNILRAVSFTQAVQALDTKRFDVVLLDLTLPDKGGEILIKEVIRLSGNTPVLVLTGYSDFDFGVRSLALGVSDYILKEQLGPLLLYKSIAYSIERKKTMAELESSEQRARSFARQLNRAIEDERARIAREIHDEFGQHLTGLKMSLSSLKKSPGVSADLVPFFDTLITDVNTGIQSLRQIANQLRPALLDKLGLFAAVEWLVSEFKKRTGIITNLYVDPEQPFILKETEIDIFRICQEALTNVARHAEATHVAIRLEYHDEQLHFQISDNGKGIRYDVLKDPLSMGLLNMRERAALIGAKINIVSSPEEGTIINLTIHSNAQENINS